MTLDKMTAHVDCRRNEPKVVHDRSDFRRLKIWKIWKIQIVVVKEEGLEKALRIRLFLGILG
jgi:hypothetical protein